jgi:hypothetical protein
LGARQHDIGFFQGMEFLQATGKALISNNQKITKKSSGPLAEIFT